MDTRETALSLFMEMEKTGAYGSALLKDTLDKYDYEELRDKAFLKRLAEGTMEKRITLDWVIDRYSKTPVKKMKPLIRSLLRLSAYQILYMDSVPDAVACSEAVRLAKKRGFSSLSGFVNGVLRSIARGKNDIAWPDPEQEPVKALSVKYSLPEWMIGLWRQQYGAERCERLLAAMEQRRPMTIRFPKSCRRRKRKKRWRGSAGRAFLCGGMTFIQRHGCWTAARAQRLCRALRTGCFMCRT